LDWRTVAQKGLTGEVRIIRETVEYAAVKLHVLKMNVNSGMKILSEQWEAGEIQRKPE
jgi:hypothetical protein